MGEAMKLANWNISETGTFSGSEARQVVGVPSKPNNSWQLGHRTVLADRYESIHRVGDSTMASNVSLLEASPPNRANWFKRFPQRVFPRITRSVAVLIAMLFSTVSWAQAPQSEVEARDREQVRKEMQAASKQVSLTLQKTTGKTPQPEIREKPLYIYDDSARSAIDGSVWAWGNDGRPDSLLTIARYGETSWVVEGTSFSTQPVKLNSRPMTGTLDLLDVPNARPPGKSTKLLASRLKALAREFKTFQMWDNDGSTDLQRYELRMLVKPVLEYSDPDNGILAGGVFLFNYGSNPELSMILEAHEDGWKCAFGRMGWAAANVTFKGSSIYKHRKLPNGLGDNRYAMTLIPRQRQSAGPAVAKGANQ